MLAARRPCVPALPTAALDRRYTARRDALTARPRGPLVWTGLLSAALGLVGGVCLTLLVAAGPQPPTVLTPQQQRLYGLVQDLAQTSTPDEAWRLMTQINKVVRTLHPQPRPRPEELWPTRAGTPHP